MIRARASRHRLEIICAAETMATKSVQKNMCAPPTAVVRFNPLITLSRKLVRPELPEPLPPPCFGFCKLKSGGFAAIRFDIDFSFNPEDKEA